MDRELSYRDSQSVLRQRNALLFFVLGLMLLNAWTWLDKTAQEEQVILVPTLDRETAISNRKVSAGYLEQVTRDVVALMLNRSPKSLTYFEDQFLRIAHSSAYGDLKKQFTKLAEEARSTDISTVFFPAEMSVDPVALTSEVTGELHAYVGNTRVSRERRRYRLTWHYAGLRLSLLAFEDISLEEAKG